MLVFVDTNVWYPVVLADLVLRSVEIGLFDLAWTDESLTEVERVLVERKGLSAANAAVFCAQVRATAPEGRIGPAADVGRTCRVVLIESFFRAHQNPAALTTRRWSGTLREYPEQV